MSNLNIKVLTSQARLLYHESTRYFRHADKSTAFNNLVHDNPKGIVEDLGFDVCWALLFAPETKKYRPRRLARPKVITGQQWEDLKKRYGNRCFYCGKETDVLTRDHVIPYKFCNEETADNIVPACMSCNRRKGTKSQREFMQSE